MRQIRERFKNLQPIERLIFPLILGLNLLIFLLVVRGDRTLPKVTNFSWENKQITKSDQVFSLTFNRPMDHESIKNNLKIDPPLSGKIAWVGKKLVYTLTNVWRYGTTYQITLANGLTNVGKGKKGSVMMPFKSQFLTADRILLYIGISNAEKGRLILFNLTKNYQTILTPPNLIVHEFKVYPDGHQVLFSATEKSIYELGVTSGYLYKVLLNNNDSKIETVLADLNYQNLKFDLSADGKVIVLQRVNLNDIQDFGLWVIREKQILEKISDRPGGDFLITPDSETIASLQPDGVVILPLAKTTKPLNFLPSFGRVLSFAKDGSKSAMVRYNSDSSQSLFVVDNQGSKKEIIVTKGEILNCQFHPITPILYCLVTRELTTAKVQEKLTLEAINLATLQQSKLLTLPYQWSINLSVADDGVYLAYDRIANKKMEPVGSDLKTETGSAIASSQIMLLSLEQPNHKPEKLPINGFNPQWLP